MPSGYTADIAKNISFREFVLRCAGFGALISMRDEPPDAPIPKEFKVSDYHPKELDRYRARLEEIQNMTVEEATEKAIRNYNEKLASLKKREKDMLTLKKQYSDMLDQVDGWEPPTEDHIQLKGFMIKQLQESIEYDCSLTYTHHAMERLRCLSGEEWIAEQINSIESSIAYHTDQLKEEIQRVNERTKWVQALLKSLPKESQQKLFK